jgi:putative transposase
MPRPPRVFDPFGVYHVIARGNDRRKVFRDRQDYLHYLSLIADIKARFGLLLYHYCLMPNHVHLELAPNGADLSSAMHRLQLLYSKYCAVRWPHVGHIWQGRFKSLHVATDEYLLAVGSYIELNPVRAGLVGRVEEWPYSSYRHYAFGERDPIVDTDPLYACLAKTKKGCREEYVRLIFRTRM